VRLLGFIIRIYHDARSHERQKVNSVPQRQTIDTLLNINEVI
jgi:hypothetical protein